MTTKWQLRVDLDEAEHQFSNYASVETVGVFMKALMDAEEGDVLNDDEWLDGLATIRDYLLSKDAKEDAKVS